MKQVVLVPGLWMPGVLMAFFAARLAGKGYQVRVFRYFGRRPYEGNVDGLARFAPQPACFVGHSLGGVLTLDMLNRHPQVQSNAVVLLGAPVRGCFAGRRFGERGLGRWMMGATRPLWDERPARWERAAPLGVVAGTLSVGLGRALGALPGPNDGVVRVDETAIDGMTERTLVSYGHSMLIFSERIVTLVDRFLRSASFA